MQPFAKVWGVWYNDGDPSGPMLLWSVWATEDSAYQEAMRLNEIELPKWSEEATEGSSFEVEGIDVQGLIIAGSARQSVGFVHVE